MRDPLGGAHVANAAAGEGVLSYRGEAKRGVDFMVDAGRRRPAIEVKSGRMAASHAGIEAVATALNVHRKLLVGGDGVKLEEFLASPVTRWIGP